MLLHSDSSYGDEFGQCLCRLVQQLSILLEVSFELRDGYDGLEHGDELEQHSEVIKAL